MRGNILNISILDQMKINSKSKEYILFTCDNTRNSKNNKYTFALPGAFLDLSFFWNSSSSSSDACKIRTSSSNSSMDSAKKGKALITGKDKIARLQTEEYLDIHKRHKLNMISNIVFKKLKNSKN